MFESSISARLVASYIATLTGLISTLKSVFEYIFGARALNSFAPLFSGRFKAHPAQVCRVHVSDGFFFGDHATRADGAGLGNTASFCCSCVRILRLTDCI